MKIFDDDYLLPIYVTLGFDILGPDTLYFIEGMYITPDGDIEHDELFDVDDLTDALDAMDIDFSESYVAQMFRSFNEHGNVALRATNAINLALVALLDDVPEEHISKATLIDAAIDAGRIASNYVEQNFSEKQAIVDREALYDIVISDYNEGAMMTYRALGLEGAPLLKKGLITAKRMIDDFSEITPPEIINIVNMTTGLTGADLARASIRLTLGQVDYEQLSQAAMLSTLAFTHTNV